MRLMHAFDACLGMGRAGATSQLPRLGAPPHRRGRRERAGRQDLDSHEPYASQQSREYVCPPAQGCRRCSLHLWSRCCACVSAPKFVQDAVVSLSVCVCVCVCLDAFFVCVCRSLLRPVPSLSAPPRPRLSLTQTLARSLSISLARAPLPPSLSPTRSAWTSLSLLSCTHS